MSVSDISGLQYPIGQFQFNPQISAEERHRLIVGYVIFPDMLQTAVNGLTEGQLDTRYRPGGWTVRQVVHHLAESHMNAYVRFKLTLTEKEHKAVVADEAAWAELEDSRRGPIAVSLDLFRALQQRWVLAIQAISPADFDRKLWHPAWGTVSVDYLVQGCAWHARHHIAHITSLRERMGWVSSTRTEP